MDRLTLLEVRRGLLQGTVAVIAVFPAMVFAKQSEAMISLAAFLLS